MIDIAEQWAGYLAAQGFGQTDAPATIFVNHVPADPTVLLSVLEDEGSPPERVSGTTEAGVLFDDRPMRLVARGKDYLTARTGIFAVVGHIEGLSFPRAVGTATVLTLRLQRPPQVGMTGGDDGYFYGVAHYAQRVRR